jgi:hypothetical protein
MEIEKAKTEELLDEVKKLTEESNEDTVKVTEHVGALESLRIRHDTRVLRLNAIGEELAKRYKEE